MCFLGVCVFFNMFGCVFGIESGCLSVFRCMFGCVCVSVTIADF